MQGIKSEIHAAPHAVAAAKTSESREMTAYLIRTLQITATSGPTPGRLASSQLLGAEHCWNWASGCENQWARNMLPWQIIPKMFRPMPSQVEHSGNLEHLNNHEYSLDLSTFSASNKTYWSMLATFVVRKASMPSSYTTSMHDCVVSFSFGSRGLGMISHGTILGKNCPGLKQRICP